MRKLWLSPIALALVLLAGCITPPGETETFHLEGSGTVTIGFTGTFSGTAQGTFIRSGAIDGSYQIGDQGFENCPSNLGSVEMQVLLTAASGDMLVQAWSGTFCFDASISTFRITGTYDIRGGSGRFGSATGSGTVIFTADTTPFPATFTVTQNGTINLNQPDDPED